MSEEFKGLSSGERIKKLRMLRGYNMEELANKVGTSGRQAVYHYESHNSITVAMAERFAEALDTTPEFILGYTDDYSKIRNDKNDKFDMVIKALNQNTAAINRLIEVMNKKG